MKELKKIAILAAVVVAMGCVFTAWAEVTAKTLANGFTYVNGGDDEPRPGVWDSRYTMVMEKAIADGIPVAIFFAKPTCGRCKKLEKSIVESETFEQWARNRGYLLLFGMMGEGESSKTLRLILSGTALPQCGVWWDKDGDGKPEVGTPKKTSWTGGAATKADTFMNNADKWLGEYKATPDYAGGTFDFEETENDRLECEDGNTSISFTLTRDEKASEVASEVLLTAKGPSGAGLDRQTISWEAGESSKEVTVNISGANFTKDGQQATIILSDTNGVEQATNNVTYVKKANSPENPLWIGERASPKSGAKLRGATPNLAFGEWTMDLNAAKALAASTDGEAFTLVSIAGSLWCPDCANTEKNFLDVKDAKGNNRFAAWAKANNIALAAIDVRRFDTNSVETTTAKGDATLLSRKAGSNGKSGRGYLTRKGVSDEEAAATLERNRQLVTTTTAEGGFHRPEDANAYRTGVPYFVLLRKDGTVAARFTRYAKSGATASDNWDDVIKRFDEMLAIAGKGETAHADASEIENNHAATTALSVEANGGEAAGELSCTDLRDAYKLANFAGNATLALAVTGASPAQVEISLWQLKNGEAAMLSGAFRTGQLSQGVQLEYSFVEAGDFFVQVAAKNRDPAAELDDEFSHLNKKAMNFTAYTLTSSAIYAPGPATATAKAPAGSKTLRFSLEDGVLYRFSGIDAEANRDALEAVAGVDGFYTAKQSGWVDLTAAEEGGTVAYQKWEPGAVGFAPDAETKKTEVTVSESQDVLVDFRRVEGSSGEVEIRVSLNKAETDFYYDYDAEDPENTKNLPRFMVNGEYGFEGTNVVWADGLSFEESVGSLLVQAAETETQFVKDYFGPGKVVFDLAIVRQTDAGRAVTIVDNAKFTVNFTEDQKPEAGTAAFLDARNDAGDGLVDKQTIYARENGSATLTVGRLGSSAGPVYATISKSVASVTLGGDCEGETALIFWANHKSDDKTVTVTNLPAAGKSVKLTLKASELSPELKVDSASNVVTIVSVSSDAPAFSAPSYCDTAYRYVSVSNAYPVVCEAGDELSFTKMSGSLPKGLKAVADSAGKALVITGVPTADDKTGKTYTAVFQVVATRGKTKVQGLTAEVSITLKNPAAAGTGSDGKALNDACVKTIKLGAAMVFALSENGEYAELAGMLTGLSLPAKGKASAKFECADGKISLSAKNWSDVIDDDPESEDYGQMRVTLVGKGGYTLDVDVDRHGTNVTAVLSKDGEPYAEISFAGTDWSSKKSAKDCIGYYTVTLPVATNPDKTPAIAEKSEGVASRAAAYLTFSMSASDANKGAMKWAGMLPNGEKVSGSSVLTDGGDGNVYLPYTSFKKKDNFAGVAKIMRGAQAMSSDFGESGEDSCYETVFTPEFDFGEGAVPVRTMWRHSEKSKATDIGDYAVGYELYGGIYDSSLGLDCCCIDGRGTDNMLLTISKLVPPSDVYGAFAEFDRLPVKVGEKTITLSEGGGSQKLTLKFDAKTGVVSGKFDLSYKDESGKSKTLSAKYSGVVQLGFGDSCGCNENPQPFVNGFWHFDDLLTYPNAGGRNATLKVKRGAGFVVDAVID